jgi:hypothetical protein
MAWRLTCSALRFGVVFGLLRAYSDSILGFFFDAASVGIATPCDVLHK